MLKSWLIIIGITYFVAFGSFFIRPRDLRWAKRLDRPRWLFFEPAIPFIWMAVFLCGATSATFVWEADPGNLKTILLMSLYLLLEVITVAYIPATLRSHHLAVGTVLGALGMILSLFLMVSSWQISAQAGLLLLPYVIWSPIGTYATRQMMDLNPDAA
jgi:translocator protein